MPEPEHIIPAEFQVDARSKSGCSPWVVKAGLVAANAGKLGAEAYARVVAMAFSHVKEDVFVLDVSVRVLNTHIDAIENTKVIKATLHHPHVGPRQRITGLQQNTPIDQFSPRIMQA